MSAPSSTNPASGSNSVAIPFRVVLIGLLGILFLLFCRSFSPDLVLFSNDGPLGAVSAKAGRMPSALSGVWQDLNWVGSNGASAAPDILQGSLWLLGPLQFSKWYVPLTLLIVSLSAWLFFRRLNLAPLACGLGAVAVGLNSDFFSTSCWGVGPQTVCFGMSYLALAAVVGDTRRYIWLRLALAGMAVGMGVMEGFDIGAIFSVFVAASIFFYFWIQNNSTPAKKLFRGVGAVAMVAVFAGFMAWHALGFLVGTNIKGVAGAEDTAEAKAARWEWATQWSLPKREALSLIVPGLFGYRMDTPDGGNYWGAAGRDASWDRYFESGGQGPPPQGFIRYAGGGSYAGVLVALVAVWAALQSFRREGSVFSSINRKMIWFWLGVMLVSLLLAFGRHAPFYQFFYALPHASAIRNPAKFIHVFTWALLIVFAYGIHGLSRRYLEVPNGTAQLQSWWAKVRGFDRRWTIGCVLAIAASLLGWMIYVGSKKGLVEYLQTVQFEEDMAKVIASHSFHAVGWFVLFLVLSVVLVTLALSGYFAGRRAKVGAVLFAGVLIGDLVRANLPWIIHWEYKQKYATNPVIEFLRDKPYEHRVAIFPMSRFIDVRRLPPEAEPLLRLDQQLGGLYGLEWQQHLFLYYNIQCLDIIQEPRVAGDKAAYEGALAFTPVRRWELTNTRYLLGPTPMLEFLNQQVDPVQKRFRVAQQFDLALKQNPAPSLRNYERVTAVPNTNGQCAVFDFTGALPRAKLYSNWRVSTNDPAKLKDWVKELQQRLPREWSSSLAAQSPTDLATLKELAEPNFDPAQTVLLADTLAAKPGTNQNPGEVTFESYAPKDIKLRAKVNSPAVLLLNDRFDPSWKVFVDGKPETLLRANFIMRGVFLQPGEHIVEFKFQPPLGPLYVSLAAIGVGIVLLVSLIVVSRRETTAAIRQ